MRMDQMTGDDDRFVFDYISDNTYWTIFLIIHGLLAVALLGALTHQAMSVLSPVRQAAGGAGFVTRFRAVQDTVTKLDHN